MDIKEALEGLKAFLNAKDLDGINGIGIGKRGKKLFLTVNVEKQHYKHAASYIPSSYDGFDVKVKKVSQMSFQ